MFDGGAQLANVTRPIVSQQRIHCIRRQIEKRLIVLLAKVAQESADQNRDVFFSFTQRRHGDAHDIEPEEQIVPEFSFADELFEIFVRGRDQSHIRAQRLIAANPFESAFLTNHAQQFDLSARIDLGYFVEENRAAVRLLKSADAPFVRAGECAFLVPE